MKKLLFALLTVCLLFGLALSTYAAEIDPDMVVQERQEETQAQDPTQEGQYPEDQQEPQDSPVTVSTLDELQSAIEEAEDGDTIALLNRIDVNSTEQSSITIGSKEKTVTLIPADSFKNQSLFYLYHVNGSISFENIIMDGGFADIAAIDTTYLPSELQTNILLSNTTIRNFNNRAGAFFFGNIQMDRCLFEHNSTYSNGGQLFFNYNAIVKMTDCVIKNGKCTGSGAGIYNNGSLEMYNCDISGNVAANAVSNASTAGGICNNGVCYIEDSYITNNKADEIGGINNSGTLAIKDSLVFSNKGKATVNDLSGRTNVTYSEDFNWQGRIPSGWYDDSTIDDRFNGESNITEFYGLTLTSDANLRLVFVFEDEITAKSDSKPDDENQTDTEPDTGSDTESETTPPTTPEEPSAPTDEDNPPDTPQQPQEPADGDNGEDNNYTPPTDYRPSQRPTRPSTSTTKPTEASQPQAQPENNTPASVKPQLACNGAVINTSQTIVLLGYGDGLLHEDDFLTRAQLATIIYRLLNDDSIALYSNAPLTFADVAADAWYAPYVKVIQAAGIVNGVGGGKYDPNGTVTWAQIVTILTRFVEPQEYTLRHIQYDGWATQAIQTAVSLGWIEDNADFTPDAAISRGELVQLVNGVLELNR